MKPPQRPKRRHMLPLNYIKVTVTLDDPPEEPKAPEPPAEEVDVVLFCDTETTGFRKGSHICEIALVRARYHKLEKLDEEEIGLLVCPPCPIPEEASAVNNITDEMVENEPAARELWGQLYPFVKDVKFFVAHNASFDIRMVKEDFQGVFFMPQDGNKFVVPIIVDTLKVAKKLWPAFPNHKLETVSEALELYKGLGGEAHRALYDTKICQCLAEKAMAKEGSFRNLARRFGKSA